MGGTTVVEPRVQVLGPVRVAGPHGAAVDVPGVNGKALIVSLVLAKGAVVSVPSLVDDIWQDDPPRNARAALQTLVSRVRAVAGDELIESVAGGYRLGAATEQVDLWQPDAPRRGEPGADLGETELAARLRDTADGVRARALERRVTDALAAGDPGDAVAAAEALTASAPYDEHAQALLMSALAAAGRRTDALRAFADFRGRLADELGTRPGAELVACNAQLLREDGDEAGAPDSAVGGSGPVGVAAGAPTAPSAKRLVIGVRAAPNELIGRDGDLAALQGLLAQSRLTTILGPGGLGKTRLAQELAGRAAAAPAPAPGTASTSVVVVELAGVREPEDVPLAVASTLGVGELSAARLSLSDPIVLRDLRTRVRSALSERPTLLVLDNCEHVVDAAAYLIDQLLAEIPSVRVLATSRAPLQLSSESVYPLEPLGAGADGHGPAVELFLERARAARPGATLPLDAVARLCEHLDGLPLAIELAAARIRSMSVDEIERRLSNRFALLRGGDRGAPERHRTLIAVIDWSWNLLSESQRRMLRRLSRFPDGFDREAAADVAVAGGPDGEAQRLEASDDLDALVTQSLVSVAEHPLTGRLRYRMLETVREFGDMALVDAGEDELVAAAMTGWARTFARSALAELMTPQQGDVIRALSVEHDNLVAVLRERLAQDDADAAVPIFAGLAPYWLVRSQFREALGFAAPIAAVVQAGRLPEDSPDAVAVTLVFATLMGLGAAYGDRRPDELDEDVEGMPDYAPGEALRAGVRAGLRLRRLVATGTVAPWLSALARLMDAARDAERALDGLRRMRESDDPLVGMIGGLLSCLLIENTGALPDAVACGRAAYEAAVRLGLEWSAAQAAQSLANLASQDDRPEEALDWAETATRGLAAIGAVEEQHQFDWVVAINRLKLGRPDGVAQTFRSFTDDDDNRPEFDTLDVRAIGWAGLAELAAADGDGEGAVRLYRESAGQFAARPLLAVVASWYLIAAAGAVAAAVRFGRTNDEATRAGWLELRRITRISARLRGGAETTDRPVLATAALGVASWLLAADRTGATEAERAAGLELFALAERMHSRQDQPMLVRAPIAEAAERVCGADALASARVAVAALPDLTACAARAIEVLRTTRL